MAESHVVSALAAKRPEIAGVIAHIERQLGQLRACLVHLDATLFLFAPNWSKTPSRPGEAVDPIRGSDEESCRGGCWTPFAARKNLSALRMSSGR